MPSATSNVLVTSSNGLQPNSHGLQPSSFLLRKRNNNLLVAMPMLLVAMQKHSFFRSSLLFLFSFLFFLSKSRTEVSSVRLTWKDRQWIGLKGRGKEGSVCSAVYGVGMLTCSWTHKLNYPLQLATRMLFKQDTALLNKSELNCKRATRTASRWKWRGESKLQNRNGKLKDSKDVSTRLHWKRCRGVQ